MIDINALKIYLTKTSKTHRMFNWTNLLKDNQMKAFKRCNERKFSKDAINDNL